MDTINRILPGWEVIIEKCNDTNLLKSPFGRSIHLIDDQYVCKITDGKVDEEANWYVPKDAYPKKHELYQRDLNEVTVLIQIEDLAPVPKILHYVEGLTIQEYIKGDNLMDCWPDISDEKKEKIKVSVAAVAKRLSTLKITTVPLKPERYANILEGELLFLHNDLNPSNIIVQDGQFRGIVDWEFAGYSTIATASALNKNMCERGESLGLDLWADVYDIIPTMSLE